MKDTIAALLKTALQTLIDSNTLPDTTAATPIKIDRCKDPKHGDLATNIALILAKPAGKNPRELAQLFIEALPNTESIAHIEIAGPGFINITLAKDTHLKVIPDILSQGELYGHNNSGEGQAIHIEYVSANPTGPLHVGHGRSAAYGSSVANLLKAAGYTVHREYYVNDYGRQMDILATSIWLRYLTLNGATLQFPTNGYKGDYVIDIAKTLAATHGDTLQHPVDAVYRDVPTDAPEGDKEAHIDALIANAQQLLGERYRDVFDTGLNTILADIKDDLAEFSVVYDEWFSEKQLDDNGLINHCLDVLTQAGHLYEQDGALWFKTTAFGDDKDRVVKRANGQTTYFASDIAYHLNKLERGYHTIIDVLGADHHGYIPRLKAGMAAMANRDDALHTQIIQFVSLYRGKEKIAMSTRSGDFVTLRALRDEVGNGAARYFYLMRKIEQPLDFDLELATSHSNDNPIHYIQYAHARICSVWQQLENANLTYEATEGLAALDQLTDPKEAALIKKLQAYQDTILRAATHFEPHVLAYFLHELANAYHGYYNACKILVEDTPLRQARLCLNQATQQVLQNGLSLLGIVAVNKM